MSFRLRQSEFSSANSSAYRHKSRHSTWFESVKHLHIPHALQQTFRRSSFSGPHVEFNHELYEFVSEVQSKEK